MRFAIALLTVICIASAIGTVVQQGQPLVNYVDQFGPFWAEVFGMLGLYRVYSTPWFLVILAFLVTSTSLCIARNAPKILADWRTFKENIRVQGLLAFHHKAQGSLPLDRDAAAQSVTQWLTAAGWKVKTQVRPGEAAASGAGVMLAARQGAANKLGYLAAHSAIVLVCVGGLLDGDLIVKVQAWSQGLQPFKGGAETSSSRLSVSNPAYRAQLFVPEGQRSSSAVIGLDEGMLVQPLPFEVELRKFKVDYYSTGMPKRFASDIVIHDPRTHEAKPFTVEVNHPVVYDGITIFQSSFEDGGSTVRLRPYNLNGTQSADVHVIEGTVGGQPIPILNDAGSAVAAQLEVGGLRVINVENMAQAQPQAAASGKDGAGATDVRAVALDELTRHLGSGAKPAGDKQLVNIGPSVTYKLRDAAGQAREYQNFMAPVQLDGHSVFLLGVRDTAAEGFRYLRVPADEDMSLQGWMRLRQALNDAGLRHEAAARFARAAAPADRTDLRDQLTTSAQRALDLFAGAVNPPEPAGAAGNAVHGGLQALSTFIEQVVPADQREHTSATLVRILNGAMFELWNLVREQAGLPARSPEEAKARDFMTQAVLSLSDAMYYPAPTVFVLDGFDQKQASVFQVTRTPGRNVVYLGCVLLIVGVFAMLYIRERRLWVWLAQGAPGETQVTMALSSTRQTLDTDREFERVRNAVLGAPDAADRAVAPESSKDV